MSEPFQIYLPNTEHKGKRELYRGNFSTTDPFLYLRGDHITLHIRGPSLPQFLVVACSENRREDKHYKEISKSAYLWKPKENPALKILLSKTTKRDHCCLDFYLQSGNFEGAWENINVVFQFKVINKWFKEEYSPAESPFPMKPSVTSGLHVVSALPDSGGGGNELNRKRKVDEVLSTQNGNFQPREETSGFFVGNPIVPTNNYGHAQMVMRNPLTYFPHILSTPSSEPYFPFVDLPIFTRSNDSRSFESPSPTSRISPSIDTDLSTNTGMTQNSLPSMPFPLSPPTKRLRSSGEGMRRKEEEVVMVNGENELSRLPGVNYLLGGIVNVDENRTTTTMNSSLFGNGQNSFYPRLRK